MNKESHEYFSKTSSSLFMLPSFKEDPEWEIFLHLYIVLFLHMEDRWFVSIGLCFAFRHLQFVLVIIHYGRLHSLSFPLIRGYHLYSCNGCSSWGVCFFYHLYMICILSFLKRSFISKVFSFTLFVRD